MRFGSRRTALVGALLVAAGVSAAVGIGAQLWLPGLGTALLAAAALLFAAGTALAFLWQEQALRKAAKQHKADAKKISDIARSVGRSAPIIRGIAEEVSKAAKAPAASGAGAARSLGGASAVAPAPAAALKAPAGHEPAIVELASRVAGDGLDERYLQVPAVKLLTAKAGPDAPVKLSKRAASVRLEVDGARSVDVEVTLHPKDGRADARAAIIAVKAFDAQGASIDHPMLAQRSDTHGPFAYLGMTDAPTPAKVTVSVPATATELQIDLVEWRSPCAVTNAIRCTLKTPNPVWRRSRSARQVRVAAILDEFSRNSFKYECDLIDLEPGRWRAQMDAAAPDLFFCESAWSGADSELRPWQGRVYASSHFEAENRGELLAILAYCRAHGIPTVFWNKEDPSHYDDRKHDFVSTAVEFDHIFTTDAACVSRYRLEHGHPSVHALPFAVQPRLFNPIERGERSDDVVFAGGWYANHRDRCRDMEAIFDAALADGRTLKIYDRYFGRDDGTHTFPERYRAFTHAPVPHAEVARVYKESTIGVTINTEQRSRTMFARRIFELMACNTLVLSNSSVGVEELFGDDVVFPDRDPDRLARLTDEEQREMRERNLARVLEEHTYARRFARILEVAGIEYRPADGAPALVVRVEALETLEAAWRMLRALPQWGGARVILLADSIEPLEVGIAMGRWNRAGVRVVDERLLGEGPGALREIVGRGRAAYLVPLEHGAPDLAAVERLRLHGQYVDAPVIAAADPARRYRFDRVELHSRPVLVPAPKLEHVVKAVRSGTPELVYQA